MSPASPLADSFLRSGKVRDLYAVGSDQLLLVASDRLSAFDVVLPTPIPDKGRVLTGLSRFWFERTADLVPNHLVGVAPEDVPGGRPADADERSPLRDLLAVDSEVAKRMSLTDLDNCFDDSAHLRHVPAVIARLDSLEAEIHVAR